MVFMTLQIESEPSCEEPTHFEHFVIPEYIKDGVAYLRKIIRSFLQETKDDTGLYEDFTWDSVKVIPMSEWAKYGVFRITENGAGPFSISSYELTDFVVGVADENENFYSETE